jgi:hypothetical protein
MNKNDFYTFNSCIIILSIDWPHLLINPNYPFKNFKFPSKCNGGGRLTICNPEKLWRVDMYLFTKEACLCNLKPPKHVV